MEWKTVKLGDILKITGGQLYKGDLLGTGDNLLLGMGCVSFLDKFLMKGARQYGGDCLDKNIGRPGDIVLATRQQSDNLPILAMPAIIPEGLPAKKIIIGSNLYKVNVTDPDFDNRFIYWLLKTPEYVNYISSVKTGTTVKMITIKDVESYTFLCPPKEIRDKISKLLWDLDDKIENNNRINANLEAQAHALFKSWFVDFEPWDGIMPEDWEEGTLGDIITEIESGSRPKGGAETCGIPSIGAEKIERFGFYEYAGEKYVNNEYFAKMKRGHVKDGDVLLYKDGAYTGKTSMALDGFPYETCAVNEHVFLLRTESSRFQFFLYFLMSYPDIKKMIHTLASAKAAQPGLNQAEVMGVDVILPSEDCINDFNRLIAPSMHLIAANAKESARLAALRDTLLPKLMKGEIAV